jgi:hypothetical protein
MTGHPSTWGIPAPSSVRGASWGARAIYSLDLRSVRRRRVDRGRYVTTSVMEPIATIDLVWDRQGMNGGSPDDQATLLAWLNGTGLAALRERCTVARLAPSSRDEIHVKIDGFALLASPRASYGYLYIGAWRVDGGIDG